MRTTEHDREQSFKAAQRAYDAQTPPESPDVSGEVEIEYGGLTFTCKVTSRDDKADITGVTSDQIYVNWDEPESFFRSLSRYDEYQLKRRLTELAIAELDKQHDEKARGGA